MVTRKTDDLAAKLRKRASLHKPSYHDKLKHDLVRLTLECDFEGFQTLPWSDKRWATYTCRTCGSSFQVEARDWR